MYDMGSLPSDVFELKLRICELETKVQMYEQHIKTLETHIERYDTNLKLSIQTPSSSGKGGAQQLTQQVFHSKLYQTVQQNIDALSRDNMQTLLESPAPAYASMVHFMEKALSGPHSQGQLIKLTTNSYCKYMNSSGEVEMDNITMVFDKLCGMVYERCKGIVIELSEKLEKLEEYDDSAHEKSSNMYTNIMLLKDTRNKARILKEITPILK